MRKNFLIYKKEILRKQKQEARLRMTGWNLRGQGFCDKPRINDESLRGRSFGGISAKIFLIFAVIKRFTKRIYMLLCIRRLGKNLREVNGRY